MKIVLTSLQDVEKFFSLFRPADTSPALSAVERKDYYRLKDLEGRDAQLRAGKIAPQTDPAFEYLRKAAEELSAKFESDAFDANKHLFEPAQDEPTSAMADASTPADQPVVAEPEPSLPDAAPEVDSTGRRWDARIDSSNKGVNKDGTWRARKNSGLSKEQVAAIKAELTPDAAPAPEPEESPIATETHALPATDAEGETTVETQPGPDALPNVDLHALIASCADSALDASDSFVDLLKAAAEFVGVHSKAELDALKATVAPGPDGGGKLIQALDPGERRMLNACMSAYPTGGAA